MPAPVHSLGACDAALVWLAAHVGQRSEPFEPAQLEWLGRALCEALLPEEVPLDGPQLGEGVGMLPPPSSVSSRGTAGVPDGALSRRVAGRRPAPPTGTPTAAGAGAGGDDHGDAAHSLAELRVAAPSDGADASMCTGDMEDLVTVAASASHATYADGGAAAGELPSELNAGKAGNVGAAGPVDGAAALLPIAAGTESEAEEAQGCSWGAWLQQHQQQLWEMRGKAVDASLALPSLRAAVRGVEEKVSGVVALSRLDSATCCGSTLRPLSMPSSANPTPRQHRPSYAAAAAMRLTHHLMDEGDDGCSASESCQPGGGLRGHAGQASLTPTRLISAAAHVSLGSPVVTPRSLVTPRRSPSPFLAAPSGSPLALAVDAGSGFVRATRAPGGQSTLHTLSPALGRAVYREQCGLSGMTRARGSGLRRFSVTASVRATTSVSGDGPGDGDC